MAQKPTKSGQDIMRDALRQHRAVIVLCALLSGICSVLMLTAPIYMLNIYNRVLSTQSVETLIVVSVIAACAYAMLSLFDYLRGRLMARVAKRCRAAFSDEFLMAASCGSAEHPMQRVDNLCQTIGSPLSSAVFDAPWAPIYFGLLFAFHPMLGWAGLVATGFVISVHVIGQWASKRLRRLASVNEKHLDEYLVSHTKKHEVLHRYSMTHMAELRMRAMLASLRADDREAVGAAAKHFTKLVLQSTGLAVGAWLVVHQEISAGAMLASSILMTRAIGPVDALLAHWPKLHTAHDDWRALGDYAPSLPKSRYSRPHTIGIEARDLTYVPLGARKPTLRQVHFTLEPGTTVGLLGRSGAGKSSILQLIAGLHTPTVGSLRISGRPAHQIAAGSANRVVGMLSDQPSLVPGSILDNITDFDPTPDDVAVQQAVSGAHLAGIIEQSSDSIDSWIDPALSEYSTSQIAQIALARAIYNAPSVLLLDSPPWHATDELADRIAQVARNRNGQGLITIITDQDPANLTICDQIIHLAEGRIIASPEVRPTGEQFA